MEPVSSAPKTPYATLHFGLPEDEDELRVALNGRDYLSALQDIFQMCRSVWKYQDDASDELIAFAHKIGAYITEVDLLE